MLLSDVDIRCCDFADVISEAGENDFVFVDPPYTTAHNLNGFIKYNQKVLLKGHQALSSK